MKKILNYYYKITEVNIFYIVAQLKQDILS